MKKKEKNISTSPHEVFYLTKLCPDLINSHQIFEKFDTFFLFFQTYGKRNKVNDTITTITAVTTAGKKNKPKIIKCVSFTYFRKTFKIPN